jgi:hypothetical protein
MVVFVLGTAMPVGDFEGVLAWSELTSLSHREVLAYGTDLKLLRARRLLGGPRRWMRKGGTQITLSLRRK